MFVYCGGGGIYDSNNEMWHLSFAENPQPPGDGVYGALGATPAPNDHRGAQGSVEQSRSTEHGTSSSSGSDPNEMSRSGTDLPHDGRESEGTAI